MTLEWKPLKPSNGSSIKYIVENKSAADEEFKKLEQLSGSRYEVCGLTGNTEYCFRVAAVNSAGQGPYKNLANRYWTSKSLIVIACFNYELSRLSLVIIIS